MALQDSEAAMVIPILVRIMQLLAVADKLRQFKMLIICAHTASAYMGVEKMNFQRLNGQGEM